MGSTVRFEDKVEVPLDIRSLADFRRWALSDDFPETGRIDYIGGLIEVDMSPEEFFCHGTLKTAIVGRLYQRVEQGDLGYLVTDQTRISSPDADLSVEPDVVFVSGNSLESGRVRLVPKASGGEDRFVEMEGGPDLVVEIVSDSSVHKDTGRLPRAYLRAGIREFWLVDARHPTLLFRIHRPGAGEWEPAPTDDEGYQFSAVLNTWYRLDRERNASGRPVYHLREKAASDS